MSTEQRWVEGSPLPESRSLEEWYALRAEAETAQDSELDVLVLQHLSAVVFPRRTRNGGRSSSPTCPRRRSGCCSPRSVPAWPRSWRRLTSVGMGWRTRSPEMTRTRSCVHESRSLGSGQRTESGPRKPGEPGGDDGRTVAGCGANPGSWPEFLVEAQVPGGARRQRRRRKRGAAPLDGAGRVNRGQL
jgi:hypothetical protein